VLPAHASRRSRRVPGSVLIALLLGLLPIAAPRLAAAPGPGFAQEADAAAVPGALRHSRLAPGVHLLSGGADGNVLLVVAGDEALLVDGRSVEGVEALRAAVAGITTARVRWVVDTHYHPDHVGANAAYAAEGATVVSHQRCRQDMTRRSAVESMGWVVEAAPQEAWPTLVYDERLTLHLGGATEPVAGATPADVPGSLTVELLHAPAAHTSGDTIVCVREAHVLHTGDIVELGAYPFLDVWHGGSLAGCVGAVQLLLARCDESTQLVPGHGPVAGRADLLAYGQMLETLAQRVQAAIAAGQHVEAFLAGDPTGDFEARWGNPRSAARLAALAFAGAAPPELMQPAPAAER